MKRYFSIVYMLLLLFVFAAACQKEVSKETGTVVVEADGSLQDSLGNCYPSVVHGTFYNGVTPGSDTAYVELTVNVAAAGTYSISTDLQNGFLFADSGFFNATGLNVIKLKPIGTPILQKSTTFSVAFDTTICGFTINVQDSTGTGLGGGGNGGGDTTGIAEGEWEFYTDSGYFHGTIDTAAKDDTLGFTYLRIYGTTGGDSILTLATFFTGTEIVPGTYTSQSLLANATFYFAEPYPSLASIYYAYLDPVSTSLMTIVITSYDSTTREVKGTFSGLANDASGNA
ncbi:MAG TPA: hypothetical protein PL045_06010, partial [Chitinophagaceae bacterium]|nr:hypothetical protein [Chitinophagaceae bacterium]